MRVARPSGIMRGMFSMNPPPVICATPLTTPAWNSGFKALT